MVARLSRPHHRSTGPGHQDIRSRSEYLLARMGKADLNLETLPKDIEDNEGIFQVKRKQPSLELPPEKPIVQTASAGTAPDRGSPLLVGAKMVGRSFLDRLSGRTEEIEKTSEPIEPPPKIERTVRPIRPPKPPARSRVVVKTPDPPAPPPREAPPISPAVSNQTSDDRTRSRSNSNTRFQESLARLEKVWSQE